MNKRLLALILTGVMVISTCIPAIAAEGENTDENVVISEVIEEQEYSEEPTLTEEQEETEELPLIEEQEVIEEQAEIDGEETIEGTGYTTCQLGDVTIRISYDTSTLFAKIYGCEGTPSGDLKIPEKTGSFTFTEIGDSAFEGCSGFTGTLTMPGSITSIGNSAFYGCSGFTGALTIPGSVTSIGADAFSKCAGFTGALTIPGSVDTIGEKAFSECEGLESINISEGVKNIGGSAFYDCKNVTSVTIPKGVESIGEIAFGNCESLTSLVIPSSVTTIPGGRIGSKSCNNLTKIENNSSCSLDLTHLVTEHKEHTWYNINDRTTPIESITNGIAVRDDYKDDAPAEDPKKDPNSGKESNKDPEKTPEKTPTSKPVVKGSYRIEFVGNGATSGQMKSMDCKLKKSYKLTANKFSRKGYTFDGWNTKKNGKGKTYKNKASIKDLAKSGKTIKLYAKWKANTYKIKFDKNGGKGKIGNLSMTYGKEKKLPTNKFTKSKYKFAGWALSKKDAKKGIVAYKNKAKVKNLSSKNKGTVTLYAVWKKK